MRGIAAGKESEPVPQRGDGQTAKRYCLHNAGDDLGRRPSVRR
jgi:hypothetical protein